MYCEKCYGNNFELNWIKRCSRTNKDVDRG